MSINFVIFFNSPKLNTRILWGGLKSVCLTIISLNKLKLKSELVSCSKNFSKDYSKIWLIISIKHEVFVKSKLEL